jgi:hypothetical protein
MGTAANVGSLADAANTLAGAEGMDFTFSGSSSALKCKHEGKDVKVLINLRAEKREDGMALFKVVRFASSKKDRRLQWFQTKAALINTADSEKADKGWLSVVRVSELRRPQLHHHDPCSTADTGRLWGVLTSVYDLPDALQYLLYVLCRVVFVAQREDATRCIVL